MEWYPCCKGASWELAVQQTNWLPPLVVGDHVKIQNQTNPHPTEWDKTGIIIKVQQVDQYQYVVCLEGSGRSTTNNQKFLRKFIPEQKQPPRHAITDDFWLITTPKPIQPVIIRSPPPNSPLRILPPCQQTEAEPLPLTCQQTGADTPPSTGPGPSPHQTAKGLTCTPPIPIPQPVQKMTPWH